MKIDNKSLLYSKIIFPGGKISYYLQFPIIVVIILTWFYLIFKKGKGDHIIDLPGPLYDIEDYMMLFIVFPIVLIMLISRNPELFGMRYSRHFFKVYEDGFIYPYRFKNLKRKNSFIDMDEINEIAFANYGLTCWILLKNGSTISIEEIADTAGYLLLVDILLKKFHPKKVPDFSMVINPIGTISKEVRIEIIKKIYEENQSFSEMGLPKEWVSSKSKQSGSKPR